VVPSRRKKISLPALFMGLLQKERGGALPHPYAGERRHGSVGACLTSLAAGGLL
jgi:hypothetical protein